MQDPTREEQLFKHFGLWNEQIESVEQEMPFQYPAAFIEFMPVKWNLRGRNNIWETDLTIRLHIVTEYDAEHTPDFFDIIDDVTAIMQNTLVLKTNRGWMRSQSITGHNCKYYIDNIEEYVCNLQEFLVPPGEEIAIEGPVKVSVGKKKEEEKEEEEKEEEVIND